MNTLLRILVVAIALSNVRCSWDSDAAEVQERVAQLNKLNESQLCEYIDSTLATASTMAQKRGNLGSQKGVECYTYLYSNYLPSFSRFVETLKTNISQETDPNKRIELLKELAGLATTVQFDEEYRAEKNPNYPLEENATEYLIVLKLKFNTFITVLVNGLNLISSKELSDNHEPTSVFYKSMADMFGKFYPESENYPEVHKQSESSERKCVTVLNKEIVRFLYLSTLRNKPVLSKMIPEAIQKLFNMF